MNSGFFGYQRAGSGICSSSLTDCTCSSSGLILAHSVTPTAAPEQPASKQDVLKECSRELPRLTERTGSQWCVQWNSHQYPACPWKEPCLGWLHMNTAAHRGPVAAVTDLPNVLKTQGRSHTKFFTWEKLLLSLMHFRWRVWHNINKLHMK